MAAPASASTIAVINGTIASTPSNFTTTPGPHIITQGEIGLIGGSIAGLVGAFCLACVVGCYRIRRHSVIAEQGHASVLQDMRELKDVGKKIGGNMREGLVILGIAAPRPVIVVETVEV